MIRFTATPLKLKNGDWGARVNSDSVQVGDIVRITTRGGKSWEAEVLKVIWSGNGISICATQSLGGGSSAGYRAPRRGVTPTGCPCGSVVEFSKPTDCWHCRHDAY